MLFSLYFIPNPELSMLSGVALDYWYNPLDGLPFPSLDVWTLAIFLDFIYKPVVQYQG